jgi:DNA-binding response OmpR family regulator
MLQTSAKAVSRGKLLLIVDDEVDITSALKIGLESHGFNIDSYNDPAVALSKFRPYLYTVAVLDIRMPQMNGFELYRQMKKIDSGLIVCFFTAFDLYEKEFEKMFPDIKVKAFFRKPVSIANMTMSLSALLDGGSQPT